MKRSIYLIALSIVTCICIVAGLMIHYADGWSVNAFSFTSSTKKVNVVKTFDSFQNISVNLDTIDLRIKQGEKFKVSYNGAENRKPKIYMENNTLYVKDNRKWVFNIIGFGFHNQDTVQITVPKNTELGKVTLQSDVSDFSLSDLSIQRLIANVDTGDMDMKNASIKDAKLESDTGDQILDQVTLQNAILQTDTGSIKMNCIGEKSDYAMNFSTDVGDITVNGKEYDHNYNNDSDGNYMIQAQTDTGDVDVNFQ